MRLLTALLVALWVATPLAQSAPLTRAIDGEHRSAEHRARDQYRHPRETLTFLEVAPDMTVVEIWPGGAGWYTEILAPYLREEGKLYAAHFDADDGSDFFRQSRRQFMEKLDNRPDIYDRVEVTTFNPPEHTTIAPPGSADRVLTFRNAHNWYMRGGDSRIQTAFEAFYRALKPGGILGVVDHRLPPDQPRSKQRQSGYLHQAYVVEQARQAGFEWLAHSDINANPADGADHPEGVWTLPPTLRLGDKNREKYRAIGESDRMTLKFVKPDEQ